MQLKLTKLKLCIAYNDDNNIKTSVITVLFRVFALGGKFLLVIYLAKVLSTEELGGYGLFSASISYALYFLGLDFYTYANRELLGSSEADWPEIIKNQTFFYCISYFILLPSLSFIFFYDLLPITYIVWFYLVLTFEHLSQESYRLLVSFKQPVRASAVAFVRSGSWTYILLFVLFTNPGTRNLKTLYIGWSAGALISLLISLSAFRELKWSNLKNKLPDWSWIKSGIIKAFPFFLGTLALRGIYTLDRFFLKFFCGESSVGVYTFYSSITNVIQHFIDAAIIINYYPKIVASYRFGKIDKFYQTLKKMILSTVLLSLLLMVVFSVCIWPFLYFVGKPIYYNEIGVFWILIVVNFIIAVGYTPHFALYAIGADKDIAAGTFLSFFFCVLLFFLLTPIWGVSGVGFAILFSSLLLGGFKCLRFLHYKKMIARRLRQNSP